MLCRMLLCAVAALPGPGDPPAAPPPPAVYDVQIRYHINANRNEHVAQYFEMLRAFKEVGFVRDPDEVPEEDEAENPTYDRMSGTVPADQVRRLLGERHVEAVQLLPKGVKPPADANAPVRVDLQLASGLPGDRQRLLADQTRRVLQGFGFQEAVGYDGRGRTRLLGSVPAGKIGDLFGDLRRLPAAWSLIAASPLTALRNKTNGPDQLEALLLTWYDLPQGKALLLPILDEWERRPAGTEFVRQQSPVLFTHTDPRTKTLDLTVLNERLIAHLAHHHDAADLLDKLYANVVASPDAPVLLTLLLNRLQAAGLGSTLPVFFRVPAPLVVEEVRPDLPVPAPRPAPPAIPQGQEKLTPDLRELLGDAAKAGAPARLEVILAQTPADDEHGWENELLRAAPGLVVEGRLGPLVSVQVAPNQAPALAALAEVATVRLPRAARPRLETAEKVEGWEPLRATGLVRLHLLNHKGQGTRLAIIDGDFSGWQALVGKQLPADTRLIDLTRSRNDDLEPDPDAGDGKTLGHGTHMALAVARAAPEVELVLIRIDPAAPYMLQQAARAINGEDASSANLRNRLNKFNADRALLDQQLTELLEERRQLLKKFTDVTQKTLLLKKKEKGVLSLDEEAQLDEILKHEAYEKKQADWDQRDRDYREATGRYFQLVKDLQNLKNVRVVASGLVWEEGHPADASSPLTRYFDDHAFASALWFQSAGDARGQAWAGLFRDANGDGVMEFDAADATHPEASWRRQLDFLSWQPDGAVGTGSPHPNDLPAGAHARVSLQWREAHDPNAGRPGEDPYLKPLANLRLMVLYQPDPAGARQPADDLEVVAQSVGSPQRLEATPSSAVYEQTVELRATKPGRYAVRIEGAAPTSIRSHEDPSIPAAERMFELHPRLFVETLEGPGRVLLHDFVTEVGTIGTPADSRGVLTVGAADAHGLPQPYSAGGPPYDVTLLFKPDLLAYDQVEAAAQGAGVATAFAAGTAAASRGPTSRQSAGWRESLGVEPGGVVRVPADWPRR